MPRLFIVSNRGCTLDDANPAAGGLAIGLKPILEERGGVWLGWSGCVADDRSEGCEILRSNRFKNPAFNLSEQEHAGYYIGFANRVLWPVLHGRTDLIRFKAEDYASYTAVNETYADQVQAHYRPQDAIWVHDYHLLLLGRNLRARGIAAPIGFFLHTPFPSADAMSAVPCHKELIEALLAYDLIGFQSRNDLANFSDYVVRHLGGTVSREGKVKAGGFRSQAGVFPIGIDPQGSSTLSCLPEVHELSRRLEPCFRHRYSVIGADRLDYSKGLPERMRAFEWMLERHPSYHGRAFYAQVAAPSREIIQDYANLKLELQTLAGTINGCYGEADWTPIRFINRTFSQIQLAALFRLARVGLVTPLRDGMNLVAKEYVAAQDASNPGVLVLSRFAGAAEQLTSALIVNPHDTESVADALHQAMTMSLEERRERWSMAMASIKRHDIHSWCESFLDALARTAFSHTEEQNRTITHAANA